MKYRVRIDRLVLDGLGIEARDGSQVARALEAELGALLVAHGLPPHRLVAGNVPALRAPPLRGPRGGPAQVGIGVAEAVHRGLTGERLSGGRS